MWVCTSCDALGCSRTDLSSAPGKRVMPCVPNRCTLLVMATKSERWNLRVTPAQDTIVRRALSAAGMSLNEYVVSRAVAAATSDLADRRIFVLEDPAWDELQEILNRPPAPKPAITALLAEPSTLEAG